MTAKPPVLTTGSYTNVAGSTISGTLYGVQLTNGGTVLNAGSIDASNGNGVMIDGVGFITNTQSAAISGLFKGIYIGGAGNIYNSGAVSGFITAAYIKGVGIVDNHANALFSGTNFGLDITGAGTVNNGGGINASTGVGIYTTGVGIVNNSLSGTISGGAFGMEFFKSAGTVVNAGLISSSNGGGIYIGNFGTVANSGAISGRTFGIGFNAGGTVLNAGSISAANGSAVTITGPALVTNASNAVITSTSFGLDLVGPGSVTNNGLIAATNGTGISVLAAGSVLNHAGGTITGTLYGIDMLGAATVTNAGFIDGATGSLGGALVFAQAAGDLIIDPGAIFNGNVKDIKGGGIIELATSSQSSFGTLAMGLSFSGFSAINFDSGATWLVSGTAGNLAAGQAIGGFIAGDTIDVQGFAETSYSFVSGLGLELTKGTLTETLNITGPYKTNSFGVSVLANGATQIVICYLRGTKILTATGEVPVESLAIGDAVITCFGGYQPIKWIGRQSYAKQFVKNNEEKLPICIKAGALGPNTPTRDLYVSPGHSMLIDNILVLAKTLVNGVTITIGAAPEIIDYYQIEFAAHDCVMAEGSWSESYADAPGFRGKFHNAAEFYALNPDYVEPQTLKLCAQRPDSGPALEGILCKLTALAAKTIGTGTLTGCIDEVSASGLVRGWARDERHPDLPVLLQISLAERLIGFVLAHNLRADLKEAGYGSGLCGFSFTASHGLTKAQMREIRVSSTSTGAEIFMTALCMSAAGIKQNHQAGRRKVHAA